MQIYDYLEINFKFIALIPAGGFTSTVIFTRSFYMQLYEKPQCESGIPARCRGAHGRHKICRYSAHQICMEICQGDYKSLVT